MLRKTPKRAWLSPTNKQNIPDSPPSNCGYLRCNVLFIFASTSIFSYLQAQNLIFFFINIAVLSVLLKMTFSGTISNCPVCRSNVRIIATVLCKLLPYSIFLLYAILVLYILNLIRNKISGTIRKMQFHPEQCVCYD